MTVKILPVFFVKLQLAYVSWGIPIYIYIQVKQEQNKIGAKVCNQFKLFELQLISDRLNAILLKIDWT